MRDQDESIARVARERFAQHGRRPLVNVLRDRFRTTNWELPSIEEQPSLLEEDIACWSLAEAHLCEPTVDVKEDVVDIEQFDCEKEDDLKIEQLTLSRGVSSEEDVESLDETASFRSVFSSFDPAPVTSMLAHKEPREERCVWSVKPVSRNCIRSRDSFVGFLDLLAKASRSNSFYSPTHEERARRGRRFYRPVARTECRLLELPPELRNRIYAAVYPVICERHVTPWELTNPNPNFLLSCRQVLAEGREFYEEARRLLWSKSHFWIQASESAAVHVRNMDDKDLNLIAHVTVRIADEEVMTLANLIDVRGGWKVDYLNTRPGQAGPGVPGGVRTEYICVHRRPSGAWKGMTWMEFHSSQEEMAMVLDRIVARTKTHAGMKDQILQILLVTPRDVERVAVRTSWRGVSDVAR